jgi:hypothetical protein
MNRPGARASDLRLQLGTHRNRAMMFAMALATTQVVGCVSDQPQSNTVRHTGQTAPADLQLTCASAAATPLGVDSSTILPVSSSQVDAQTYQVVLQAGGARANCVVDSSGNVISVQKV